MIGSRLDSNLRGAAPEARARAPERRVLLIDAELLLGALLLALALDALLGDPRRLWRRLPHPVVVMGRAIARLEERWLDGAAPAPAQARRGRTAALW